MWCYFFVKWKLTDADWLILVRNSAALPKKSIFMNLTQEQWALQLNNDQNAVVLDVRTPDEWEEGVIPGALMIDIYTGQEFLAKIDSLEKSKNYYVYCKAGSRSAQACEIMNQMGFQTTYNLLGGISQWRGERILP